MEKLFGFLNWKPVILWSAAPPWWNLIFANHSGNDVPLRLDKQEWGTLNAALCQKGKGNRAVEWKTHPAVCLISEQ